MQKGCIVQNDNGYMDQENNLIPGSTHKPENLSIRANQASSEQTQRSIGMLPDPVSCVHKEHAGFYHVAV